MSEQRIPLELQAIFLTSNGGDEVHVPPKNGSAFKVFSRWGTSLGNNSSISNSNNNNKHDNNEDELYNHEKEQQQPHQKIIEPAKAQVQTSKRRRNRISSLFSFRSLSKRQVRHSVTNNDIDNDDDDGNDDDQQDVFTNTCATTLVLNNGSFNMFMNISTSSELIYGGNYFRSSNNHSSANQLDDLTSAIQLDDSFKNDDENDNEDETNDETKRRQYRAYSTTNRNDEETNNEPTKLTHSVDGTGNSRQQQQQRQPNRTRKSALRFLPWSIASKSNCNNRIDNNKQATKHDASSRKRNGQKNGGKRRSDNGLQIPLMILVDTTKSSNDNNSGEGHASTNSSIEDINIEVPPHYLYEDQQLDDESTTTNNNSNNPPILGMIDSIYRPSKACPQSASNPDLTDQPVVYHHETSVLVPPQEHYNTMLSSRGYSTEVYTTIELGYYHKPTPLQLASYTSFMVKLVKNPDSSEELRDLLCCGLSPNPCNAHGESLLHLVCRLGYYKHVYMMIRCGSVVHIADANGRTPLHMACWGAAYISTKTTKETASTEGSRDNDDETTILKSLDPFFRTIDLLLTAEAYLLHVTDCRNETPLSYIRKSSHWLAWISYLESRKETLWPIQETNQKPVPLSLRLQLKTQVMKDPDYALDLPLAMMVAKGNVSPDEALVLQPGMAHLEAGSNHSHAHDDDDDDDDDDDGEDESHFHHRQQKGGCSSSLLHMEYDGFGNCDDDDDDDDEDFESEIGLNSSLGLAVRSRDSVQGHDSSCSDFSNCHDSILHEKSISNLDYCKTDYDFGRESFHSNVSSIINANFNNIDSDEFQILRGIDLPNCTCNNRTTTTTSSCNAIGGSATCFYTNRSKQFASLTTHSNTLSISSNHSRIDEVVRCLDLVQLQSRIVP